MTRIIRLRPVLNKSGLSRSTHYEHIADGLMTRPVALGARAVGWPESEIDAINAARIAGKSANEIRDLVANLETARKSV